MAHLIELHTAGKGETILFNLDTMVSAERNFDHTTIQTRWGYQNVRETLEEISATARQQSLDIDTQ